MINNNQHNGYLYVYPQNKHRNTFYFQINVSNYIIIHGTSWNKYQLWFNHYVHHGFQDKQEFIIMNQNHE